MLKIQQLPQSNIVVYVWLDFGGTKKEIQPPFNFHATITKQHQKQKKKTSLHKLLISSRNSWQLFIFNLPSKEKKTHPNKFIVGEKK